MRIALICINMYLPETGESSRTELSIYIFQFECCGVVGRFDWVSNQIPISCCHIDYGTISPFECNTANAYSEGCASALGDWLAYNAYVMAVSALVATCLQVSNVSMVVSWYC